MQRGCGWCAGGANASLVGEPIACVAMREDPCDEPRVGDFGDDVQGRTNAAGAWMRRSGDTNGTTTAWTVTEVDLEHSANESRDGRGRAKQAGIVPDNPLHSRHCTWMCRCREAQDVRERPSMAVRCPSRDVASSSSVPWVWARWFRPWHPERCQAGGLAFGLRLSGDDASHAARTIRGNAPGERGGAVPKRRGGR